MTDDLYAALLVERFGTVADWERERRRAAPREVSRRRRVLYWGLRS